MKANLTRYLRIGVSLSLIVYLLSLRDLHSVGQRLAGIQPQWLVAAFALLLTQTVISSVKWKLILDSDDIQLPLLYLFRIYLVGGFVSQFLPTSFGGLIHAVPLQLSRWEYIFIRLDQGKG